MKGNPVGWFEIYVQDMDRAKAFYEEVLQRKLERLPTPDLEMWSFPGEQGPLCQASLRHETLNN